MNRRKVKAEKLPEYIYDWQERYTDDPMCRPLGYRDESPLIFCNDKLVVNPRVSFCQSGEKGFYVTVEVKDGKFVTTKHCGRIIVEPNPRHSVDYGRVITCKRSEIVEAT